MVDSGSAAATDESIAGENKLWEAIGASSWCPSRPSLQQVTAFIQENLEKCVNSHQACSSQAEDADDKPRVPDRLLYLGNVDQDNDTGPVLIETNEHPWKDPQSKHYVALSHCWGSQQPIKTTQRTYNKFKESMTWSILPKTFQDAIVVSRSLKIDHIWIDSLCIIQDDPNDWAKQASKMAMIYENAHLTLCATGSPDSQTGLFLERDSVHAIHGARDGHAYTVYVRQMIQHKMFHTLISGQTQQGQRARDLPGQSRGWILQEHLLSRRAVHFTHEELIWDCYTQIVCECQSINQGAAITTFKQDVFWSLHANIDSALSRWYEIIRLYAHRIFTKDSDRLPALSGLARKFEADVGLELGTYYAGLWTYQLLHGLSWSSWIPGRRPVVSDEAFRSNPPSWSWAAVEGSQLNWPNDLEPHDYVAQVLDVATYPSTLDAKGMVSGGRLWIQGALLPLVVSWSDSVMNRPPESALPSPEDYAVAFVEADQSIASPAEEALGHIMPDVILSDDGLASGCTLFFLHLANLHLLSSPPKGIPQGLFLAEVKLDQEIKLPDGIGTTGGQTCARAFRRVGYGGLLSVAGAAALHLCESQIIIVE
jgi:hypothetical protein